MLRSDVTCPDSIPSASEGCLRGGLETSAAARASAPPELTERVRAVAERLGYRPNLLARGLATGETGMVGVLVPQLRSPYFHEVIKAIGVGAGQEGYRMLVLESDDRAGAEPGVGAALYAHVD